ncbi:MAG: sulfotransferase domain-containing protein [Actinomycetota bacterium]
MREYVSLGVDSTRWSRFELRDGDVIISTPSKCGTTWMQTLVAMLLLDRVDLGEPISVLSPWLDAKVVAEDEVFARLDAQNHRRFIKTHTPLDGIPRPEGVTVITVVRHPLDVALSDRDHGDNADPERARTLITASGNEPPEPSPAEQQADERPTGDREYLRWWIDREKAFLGTGPHGLLDLCHQAGLSWEARHEPNVALFHYGDLWSNLEGEVRLLADVLDVSATEQRLGEIVEATTIDSMRGRAEMAAPWAELGVWRDPAAFFRVGGTRPWAEILTAGDLDHFHVRLAELAGDAADWILAGRAALD